MPWEKEKQVVMDDLFDGLLELSIQEGNRRIKYESPIFSATTKSRDLVVCRAGPKPEFIAKAKEAATKAKDITELLKTYDKTSLMPIGKEIETALGGLIRKCSKTSTPEEIEESLRALLTALKNLQIQSREVTDLFSFYIFGTLVQ